MSDPGPAIFHAPALAAQFFIAVFAVVTLLGAIALYLDIFVGLRLVSGWISAATAALDVTGAGAALWTMTRPLPVLMVDGAGLDWRFPDDPAGRIGWDRIEGYALHAPGDLAGLGREAPPGKAGERFIGVRLRADGRSQFLAAFEMDLVPDLDAALAAMRRYRPDLDRTG